jgi:hypothetical protein
MAASAIEYSPSAFEAGGEFVSPGTTESSAVIEAPAHGGEIVSPGAQGGEIVSPAKAVIDSAQSNVTEIPSRLRFFIFSPLRLGLVAVF